MTARALKRPAQGLDPMPSLAELRRMYETRTGKALDEQGVVRIVSRPRQPVAEATAATAGSGMVTLCAVELCAPPVVIIGDTFRGIRDRDSLRLTFNFPPRTKKNGTTLGIRQKRAYRLYRDAIIRVIEAAKGQLGLPLPAREYNIRATYYVDRYGKTADKCGLDQGLYDALENAGVVANDWCFRRDDGTRIVPDDPRPRVEVHITPIDGAA